MRCASSNRQLSRRLAIQAKDTLTKKKKIGWVGDAPFCRMVHQKSIVHMMMICATIPKTHYFIIDQLLCSLCQRSCVYSFSLFSLFSTISVYPLSSHSIHLSFPIPSTATTSPHLSIVFASSPDTLIPFLHSSLSFISPRPRPPSFLPSIPPSTQLISYFQFLRA